MKQTETLVSEMFPTSGASTHPSATTGAGDYHDNLRISRSDHSPKTLQSNQNTFDKLGDGFGLTSGGTQPRDTMGNVIAPK